MTADGVFREVAAGLFAAHFESLFHDKDLSGLRDIAILGYTESGDWCHLDY